MSEYYLTREVYENDLYHHGVKGQKWGERRYQNEDGSLTPEGREHYGYGEARSRLSSAKSNLRNLEGRQYKRDAYYGALGHLTKTGRQLSKDIKGAKKEYKEAKQDYKIAKKETKRDEDVKAVNEYQKLNDKATEAYEKAWNSHNLEGMSSKTVKLYAQYDKLEANRKEAYKNTGRNYAERILNNAKYSNTPVKLTSNKTDTSVTKKVKSDYNNLTSGEFTRKYSVDKDTYAKRVEKYGDPYARVSGNK